MPFRSGDWGLIGTGIHHGQPKAGVEKAYALLEKHGILSEIKDRFSGIHDWGDLAPSQSQAPYQRLYEKSHEIIKKKETPLFLGGDHSQAFATGSALIDTYPDLKIIWVDAHGDINTPSTSPTGNLHGMPLSGLLGLADKDEFQMPWLNQSLKPENVALVGIRDLDRGEMKLIKDKGVLHYSASHIKKVGMANTMDDLKNLWGTLGPVHLSFDIDGMDSKLVPATGTPVPQGLDIEDMKVLVQKAKSFFDLVSCEVVELNPDLALSDEDLKITLQTVKAILTTILESPV